MPTVGSGVYWPGLVILGRGMPHWLSGLVYALNPLWPNYSLKNGEAIRTQAEVSDLAEALADPKLRELLDAVAERAATLADERSAALERKRP
jgi:hypothetical protein